MATRVSSASPPGGEGTAQVATGEACVVDFTATVLRLPDVDTRPLEPGVQTYQVLSVAPRTPTVSFARTTGAEHTTVLGDPTPPPPSPIALYRSSNSVWSAHDDPVVQWGTSGGIAVPGDYDGDGIEVRLRRPDGGLRHRGRRSPAASPGRARALLQVAAENAA